MEEKRYKEIRKENDNLIDEFEKILTKSGLVKKTIRNHVNNVSFYLNDYLLDHYDDVNTAKGIDSFYIQDFFDYFFIRKCMWSTPATIRSTLASIKKFYKFMNETNRISKEEYEYFLYDVKESVDDWCNDCEMYNNGNKYIVI